MPGKRHLRFLAIATLAALVITLGAALPGVSGEEDEDKNKDMDQALPIPDKAELNYPNLGSRLDQLVAQVEEGEMSVEDAAGDAPVHRGESVAVTIYLSGNVDAVVSFLEDSGGSPRNVGGDYIEAYVPVSLLGPVSEQTGVVRVREIVPPEPEYGDFTSQGVQAHLSEAWNQAGYSGQGVKVGIIDVGFKDLTSLMGTELPVTVQARCYTDIGVFTQDLADCEAVDDVTTSLPECLDYVRDLAARSADHGTIVAESVIDIAPEVTLYIAKPQSRGDLRDATDWMVSEGVSVINHSVGWTFDGPGDGTSPLSASPLNTVDRAVASNILWVNAAGNNAQETWFGGYSDPDDDKFINFISGDVEVNSLPLRACRSYRVQLRWEDDWNGASTDLDLYLYHIPTRTFTLVYSEDGQSGQSGHVPFETFFFESRVNSDDFGIVVVHHSGDAPDWIQLAVWSVDPIQHHTGSGSIINPAESANSGMLAVGAAPWYDVNTIESYSSRGPTPDGRFKPDIAGADCGETALAPLNENRRGFCGTSQAAPHVAGMAALVRQRFPGYTPAQVASYLKDHAQQRESPDPNNTWGHGFAQLPPVSECSDAVPSAASNPGLVTDCEALLAARDTLAGSGTLNWSRSTAIGSWDGVTVDGSPLRVTKLNLRDSQLTGTIPPELSGLTSLETLALGGNRLTGPVPTWLDSLTNLQELYLWGNQLTGPIPSEWGSLTNLERLHISRNQLTGQIPSQLASLTNLQRLSLYGNQLSGPVPTWLGSLTNLELLYLSLNQLTGPIPSELGSLTNLRGLSLSDNQLTGPIPSELGSLANLESLSLTRNQLTGPIPPELIGLTSLETLALGGNQLTGPVPTWLDSLTNLQGLYLWGNQLTGPIPSELGSLTNLEILELGGNQLTGPVPSQLASLTNLQHLSLYDNQLSGPVPIWLGSLTNLEWLHISRNQLTGQIPSQLASLTNLQRLSFYDNQLIGTIPTWLGNLANLERLYLSQNQLTGPIPSELGSLTNLRELWLNDNQLTGPIPTGLGSLANLEELFLSGNQLTGCIPVGIAGVANNDFNQLGLPFCAGALGAPTIGTVTPGADFLTITWAAPTGPLESAIIAYDLRYIESAASDKSDDNWTVVEDVWTAGSGALSYQIAGLTDGTQYDLEMRAVSSAGDGHWSATVTGTTTVLTVVFSDLNWQSAQLQNHIARYIVENGYGYPTNAVSSPKLQALQALRDGDSHVMMEIWLPQLGPAWEEALESGEVLSPGASLGENWQSAFVIPAYLQAQHPGLDSVEDLKEQRYKDLFKTAETGEKARLVSCVEGWACEMTNAEQVEGYGIADHVHIVNPSNGADLYASLNDAYERQEPWLGFQWGTSGPALLLDLVRLEEPEHSDECWQTTKACAYEDSTILIGVNASLPDLAPGVVEFLRQWNFSIDIHLRNVSRWQDFNPGASLEDAALYWLGSNVGIWSGWVTGEAATGILATLPLIVRYDANGNGMIEKNEVINAINDYLFGEGDEAISKAEVIRLINLYLFG